MMTDDTSPEYKLRQARSFHDQAAKAMMAGDEGIALRYLAFSVDYLIDLATQQGS